MDRASPLPHTYSIGRQKSADPPVENRAPELRLSPGASLIVISLLSLGIWVATFLGSAVLG
jgi:hypothetical protein